MGLADLVNSDTKQYLPDTYGQLAADNFELWFERKCKEDSRLDKLTYDELKLYKEILKQGFVEGFFRGY